MLSEKVEGPWTGQGTISYPQDSGSAYAHHLFYPCPMPAGSYSLVFLFALGLSCIWILSYPECRAEFEVLRGLSAFGPGYKLSTKN